MLRGTHKVFRLVRRARHGSNAARQNTQKAETNSHYWRENSYRRNLSKCGATGAAPVLARRTLRGGHKVRDLGVTRTRTRAMLNTEDIIACSCTCRTRGVQLCGAHTRKKHRRCFCCLTKRGQQLSGSLYLCRYTLTPSALTAGGG